MERIRKVQIETLRGCNARCRICTYKDEQEHSLRPMHEDVFASIVRQIRDLANLEVVCLYNHNEPLLDRGLAEKIRFVKSLLPRIRVEISTNGLLLTDRNVDEICELVDDLWISFHGVDQRSYEFNMGNLPWSNALKLRRLIRERPEKFFVLSIGLTPEYDEGRVRRFWEGFRNVKLMTFYPRSRAGNIRSDAVQYFHNPPESSYDCWRFNLFLMYNMEGGVIPCSNDVGGRHVFAGYTDPLPKIMQERDRFREMNRTGLRTICWECEDAVAKRGCDGRLAVQGR